MTDLVIASRYSRDHAFEIFDSLDLTAATLADYRARLLPFLDFIERSGFNRDTFLEYKRELRSRVDLSTATKSKLLTVARVFLKELNRQGLLPADITQNIKSFSQSRKHKKDGLTDAEVARLSRYLQLLPRTPTNARLKAILSLLTLQGLRQIEVVRLDVSDLYLSRGVAYVQGKGYDHKEVIRLHPETVRLLSTYLTANKVADGALFTSNSNNSLRQRLTTRSIQRLVCQVFQELGIAKSVHGLRHYYATKLIRAYGGDLLQVARYTRHSSISTLQVYFDDVQAEADLPRYYQTFEDVRL